MHEDVLAAHFIRSPKDGLDVLLPGYQVEWYGSQIELGKVAIIQDFPVTGLLVVRNILTVDAITGTDAHMTRFMNFSLSVRN